MSRAERKRKKDATEMRPHIQIAPDTVENPLFSRAHAADKHGNAKLITVVRNIRESAVSVLVAKGALNPAQAHAADTFRQLFEAMGSTGARGVDPSKEFVDGGRFPDPIGQHAIDAGKKLAAAYKVLVKAHGVYAWRLVGYICGEGRNIHEMTATRRQRDTMTDLLRMYLDCLAVHWDFQTNRG